MNGSSRNRIITIVLVVLVLMLAFSSFSTVAGGEELSYTEFREAVRDDRVASVTFTGQNVSGEYAEDAVDEGEPQTFSSFLPVETVVGTGGIEGFLAENDVEIRAAADDGGIAGLLLPLLFPLLLFGGFIYFLNRQARGQMGGLGQIGKSQAKIHKTDEPSTTFDDIAGYAEVKEEIKEVVQFLRDPSKFRQAGAEVPKGMLMVGPPGTGTTLLARAVAGEAGVPFISVTGSDFMEMFVGVGASRVRDLFKTARENAPSIIFIDELDSIGRKRGAGLGGGHDEREQTLNQMLGEIDGFEGSSGVVIMAATNRPDVLDPALTRPGRFDRQIVVPLPTLEEREEILRIHMRGKPIGADVDAKTLARGTPGMAGADLKNLVNEAALIAVRSGSAEIRMDDLERARERQTIGRERSTLHLSEKEKESVAYHEGGHALAAFLESEADPVYKVTVLPVGMALGVTTQLPVDERHIHTLSYLEAKLRVMLGGRAAELVALGQPTTGASNDLLQATKLARAIVREFGMTEAVGPVGYGEDRPVFLGEELGKGHDYSDDFARAVDAEAHRILSENLAQLVERFRDLRGGLDSMAELLVEREAISGNEALQAVKEGIPEHLHHLLTGQASEVKTVAAQGTNGHGPPVGLGVPAGQPTPPSNGNGGGIGRPGPGGRPPTGGPGTPPPPPPGAPVPPPR
ncbi:ATP-dependent zinc metalloprotease FtsH [Euzebya sp.]|uniref:ATP-dependent zinc metalloprotease FtsH n=1 Tax=Euzebya sp. TaxID=1971409 RepID=UPI003512DEA0